MCVCMFAYVGYDVSWNILDTADFGLPQRRRRCYMLAFLSPVRQEASYLRIVSLVILHTCRFVKPFVVCSFCLSGRRESARFFVMGLCQHLCCLCVCTHLCFC